jgi:hypothetical protein
MELMSSLVLDVLFREWSFLLSKTRTQRIYIPGGHQGEGI